MTKELTEEEILNIEASYAKTGQHVDWAKKERRRKNKRALKATVTVKYILNGEDILDMKNRLINALIGAINRGLLTGDSMAEVDEFRINIDKGCYAGGRKLK